MSLENDFKIHVFLAAVESAVAAVSWFKDEIKMEFILQNFSFLFFGSLLKSFIVWGEGRGEGISYISIFNITL